MVTSVTVLQQRHLRSMVLNSAAGLCTCTVFCKVCYFPRFQLVLGMPYTHKALRQYVLHKTLCKIFVAQRHCFGTAQTTLNLQKKMDLY